MFNKLNIKNTDHSYPDLQPLPRRNSSSANVNKLSKILLCHLFWIQNRANRSSIHLPLNAILKGNVTSWLPKAKPSSVYSVSQLSPVAFIPWRRLRRAFPPHPTVLTKVLPEQVALANAVELSKIT